MLHIRVFNFEISEGNHLWNAVKLNKHCPLFWFVLQEVIRILTDPISNKRSLYAAIPVNLDTMKIVHVKVSRPITRNSGITGEGVVTGLHLSRAFSSIQLLLDYYREVRNKSQILHRITSRGFIRPGHT